MTLHHAQKFHDDLRGRANENLTLALAFSIDNIVLYSIAMSLGVPDKNSQRTRQSLRTDMRTILNWLVDFRD